jgi:3-hydroxyisobutyrate dehydrogenase-like beta-hydroxyacid dehydrogenase
MAGSIERVGLIGLGAMGRPMGRHMIAKGFKVAGFDVRAESRAEAEKLGIALKKSPAEVAAASQLVIIVVGFDADLERAMFGENGVMAGAQPGTIVAVSSTVAPETMKKIEKRIAGSGVALIDTPLCGPEPTAQKGELLIMGGGDEAAFEQAKPAFSAFSKNIFYLGATGSGQVGKMVNNMILWACICADFEGLDLGAKMGVDREALRQALVHSSASNWALATQVYNMPLPWAEKDMTIVIKEADMARISLPVAGVVREVIKGYKIARGEGMPEAGD